MIACERLNIMQTDDKLGVVCDKCGTTYKMDFEYYSFDFRRVRVYNGIKQSLSQIFNLPVALSIDLCSQCFEVIADKVVSNYQASLGIRKNNIVCDLTNLVYSGTFNYYYCSIAKVIVRIANKSTIADNRFLEINIGETLFDEMKKQAESVQKLNNGWTTK